MTLEFFLWKVNFISSRNFLEGYTFPIVPFSLVQFMDFKILRAQFSVSSRSPLNSFNIPKNIKTKILMLHQKSCSQPNCLLSETEKTIKVLISKIQKLYLDHLLLQLRFQWRLTFLLEI